MSIASEITRLQNAKLDIKASIENKGVTVGDGTIDTYASKINEISTSSVEINDLSYMFFEQKRQDYYKDILKLCKDVINMNYMFGAKNGGYYSKLTKIDMKNFDTSKVTNMSYAFQGCHQATEIDVTGWDTSKCTNMMNMFSSCSKMTTIDISSFTTGHPTNTGNMFYYCSALTKLIIDNPNLFVMTSTTMLEQTPIAKGTGYVYVPDDMVDTYKSATNWSTYASQIKGMSELV